VNIDAAIIERARAIREHADALWELLHDEPPGVRLPVPWMSQLGPGAEFAPGDCGPACLAMWLDFLGFDVTVDDVSAHSGLDRGFRYTTPAHLIHAARYWNVNLYWRRYLSLADLADALDAGQPCIVLVNYPSLPERYDARYQAGHWLLVTGYDTTDVIYHDPYWPSDRGRYVYATRGEFDRAWANNHLNGNSDRQALRLQL